MNNQYTYNQPPMGQMMPPPPAPMPMRQRVMSGVERMKDAFPKWLTQYSIVAYILVLMITSFMYSAYSLPWYYMLAGVIEVVVFFLYGSSVVKDTSIDRIHKSRHFEKRIFIIALVPRVLFTLLLYWIFLSNYQDAFGFEDSDAKFYDTLGQDFAVAFRNGNFISQYTKISKVIDVSDLGYAIYVGLIYFLTGSDGTMTELGLGGDGISIFAVRLLKCLLSAYSVVLIYRLTKRNFGDQTARIAAIFCAMWPNFWYYCSAHLKETEMVFLSVLFVEQADQMLRYRQFTAWKVIPVLLIGSALFTVRTPLALVAFLSLIFSIVMSSSRVVSWGKRVIVGGLAIILIGVTMGNQIEEQSKQLFETAQSDTQRGNMEWRSKRDNGNAFAKYAGKSVFAPLIFSIPFPTMVRPYEGQEVQQLLNGGNYIKNIISGFTILTMVLLLISGRWREHLLPLSFLLGYLLVLTMSTFAQSERFHQPAMPFEFMYAAYGLSIAVTKPKYKRWFTYWCALMFVAAIAWNWFKLAGRGLV